MENTQNNIYSTLYQESKEVLFESSPEYRNRLRANAYMNFEAKGFPGKKDETYKYTYLEPYFNNGYKKYLSPQSIFFDTDYMFKCDVPSLDSHVIILLNGFYYDKLNPVKELPGGIIIGSFFEAMKRYPDLIVKHLGKYATLNDSFVSLNTIFSQDGIFMYVPKDKVLKKPIQIINVLLAEEHLMVQHRNLFIIESNSQAKVIICDHTLSPQKFLTNSVTEIYLGERADFDYFKVQNEHNDSIQVSHTFVNQETSSNLQSCTITLHGGLVRNNLYVKLNGENCNSNMYGLCASDKSQHIDNFIFVDHAKPNCISNQLFKNILDETSTGAFTGKILVERESQKTNAYQRNSSILIGIEAKMHSKPQLEIYADDVKCSHGSTVGQIDEEALFYLRSRGINEKDARLMLMFAFTREILDEIKIEPLKDRMIELIDKRLRGELSRCHNCALYCG